MAVGLANQLDLDIGDRLTAVDLGTNQGKMILPVD